MSKTVSAKDLLDAGAHFGHQARRWNPKMAEYLYGVQDGVHVFDLIKTKALIEEALEVIKNAIKDGKVVLLLGTKKQAKEKIIEIGKETGCPYVSERWLGGTLTNFEQIKRSISKLADTKEKKASGYYSKFTKKERLMIDLDIARMERFLGGITQLTKIPDLMVIVDTHKEIGAVKEAIVAKVQTIGICDSNSDPMLIDYPIPMNDDANKAIEYVLDLIKDAILEGNKSKSKIKSKEEKQK